MKVGETIAMMADQFAHVTVDDFAGGHDSIGGGGAGGLVVQFVGHRFDIEVQLAVGMVDEIEEDGSLARRGEKVGVGMAKGFQGNGDAEGLAIFGRFPQEVGGAVGGVVEGPVFFD